MVITFLSVMREYIFWDMATDFTRATSSISSVVKVSGLLLREDSVGTHHCCRQVGVSYARGSFPASSSAGYVRISASVGW